MEAICLALVEDFPIPYKFGSMAALKVIILMVMGSPPEAEDCKSMAKEFPFPNEKGKSERVTQNKLLRRGSKW